VTARKSLPLTANHWGTYRVETHRGKVTALHDFEEDVDPSPIGHGIVDVLDGPTRIKAPMVRKSWLEHGPGIATDKRGTDPFIQISWEVAEKLVADELNRVRQNFGNESIFAGSYGWASAGRFHHAQSQLRRFLNCIGGFTKSVNSYSLAAGEVILTHVLGDVRKYIYSPSSWQSIIDASELIVAFGGMPLKNGQITQGGTGRHRQREAMQQAKAAGIEFVNISPLRSDAMDEVDAHWLPARPSTDTAILLGLAHTLLVEELHDRDFLDRYSVGFDQFAAYLRGETDGIEKSADWASDISELPAHSIRKLARRMAGSRTMLSMSWSMTRQDHGEQPFWAAITLAAMIGQIGLPGGGIGFGYSAVNTIGNEISPVLFKAFPQGKNPVEHFIPVARISDLLLNPGKRFDYNGSPYTYPDTRIVYWAGGNPFHHHQDLNRMLKAWQKPDTVIVHEWCWNALAKYADIVLPCTTTLEREDLALTPLDPYVVSMGQAVEPVGEARNDFDIFRGIARVLGVEDAFTEGRDAAAWQRWIYEQSRVSAAGYDIELPPLEKLKRDGWFKIKAPHEPTVMLSAFRADPEAHPLKTSSGKIEIYSEVIEGFGYDDCPPHPAWMEPAEYLGSDEKKYPLHMISNQPKARLHSQLDHGSHSRATKINGREPVMMHPEDATARQIADGDLVRVFNHRGACLCSAVISDQIRPRVIQISTGAWFDPVQIDKDGVIFERGLCKHGNPNVLTLDKGTSRLAQGPIAHTCLVDIEKFTGQAPPVSAFDPPEIIKT
jgi:biotin/methionine sulfoxide reductase